MEATTPPPSAGQRLEAGIAGRRDASQSLNQKNKTTAGLQSPDGAAPPPRLGRACASRRPLRQAGGREGGAGGVRKEGRRLGEKEATPITPTFLRMRHTSASSIFDASATAQLSSRPEVGGAGPVFAVGSGCGTPLRPRPWLWEGGVCWAFLFVLREGRRPVVSFLVARSDPRGPRRGWRGKCGARRGAQRGPLAGREGRVRRPLHRNWRVCFALSRPAVPPPPTTRGPYFRDVTPPLPPPFLGTESSGTILRDQEASYRRRRCQTT